MGAVSRGYIERAAMGSRHTMGYFFRRSLGLERRGGPEPDAARARWYRRRFEGAGSAFRNRRGVDPDAGRW